MHLKIRYEPCTVARCGHAYADINAARFLKVDFIRKKQSGGTIEDGPQFCLSDDGQDHEYYFPLNLYKSNADPSKHLIDASDVFDMFQIKFTFQDDQGQQVQDSNGVSTFDGSIYVSKMSIEAAHDVVDSVTSAAPQLTAPDFDNSPVSAETEFAAACHSSDSSGSESGSDSAGAGFSVADASPAQSSLTISACEESYASGKALRYYVEGLVDGQDFLAHTLPDTGTASGTDLCGTGSISTPDPTNNFALPSSVTAKFITTAGTTDVTTNSPGICPSDGFPCTPTGPAPVAEEYNNKDVGNGIKLTVCKTGQYLEYKFDDSAAAALKTRLHYSNCTQTSHGAITKDGTNYILDYITEGGVPSQLETAQILWSVQGNDGNEMVEASVQDPIAVIECSNTGGDTGGDTGTDSTINVLDDTGVNINTQWGQLGSIAQDSSTGALTLTGINYWGIDGVDFTLDATISPSARYLVVTLEHSVDFQDSALVPRDLEVFLIRAAGGTVVEQARHLFGNRHSINTYL